MNNLFIELTLADSGEKFYLNINGIDRFHRRREPSLNALEKTLVWTGKYHAGDGGEQDDNGELYYVVEEEVKEILELIKRGNLTKFS